MTSWQRMLSRVASASLMLFLCPIGTALGDDSEATELIQQMSAAIAGVDSFIITGDGYVDARLSDGRLIEHSMDVKVRLSRPGSMRITRRSSDVTKEIYFDDGVLTVASQPPNFYAQEIIDKDIDGAVDHAIDDLGIDAPMLDFVVNDVASHLLEDAESVTYLGTSLFRGNSYEHVAIRMASADIQLWIAAEGPALPGKLAIKSRWLGGSPRSVYFLHWDTEAEIDARVFRFEPPEGSAKIDFDRNWQPAERIQ